MDKNIRNKKWMVEMRGAFGVLCDCNVHLS